MRINRRRDARDDLTGQARRKSQSDRRPDEINGKYTLPKDATQAPRYLERGAVGGQVQRLASPRAACKVPLSP